MFLFILESIGTPELILIAVVALIVLGPRKLPQMAKTVAKTIAEFRNATNEFKTTWEKEVAFEEEVFPGVRTPILKKGEFKTENSISQSSQEIQAENQFQEPQIKELTSEEIAQNFQIEQATTETQPQEDKTETTASNKRDWL